MNYPKVSILIPTVTDRWDLLQEARASLAAQTYRNFEVLISESEPGVRSQTKWNNLFKAAAGEYVVWLSDDDMLTPTYLEETLAVAETGPFSVVYTDHQLFGTRSEIWKAHPWTLDSFRKQNPVLGITALVRKAAWPGWPWLLGYSDWAAWYEMYCWGFQGMRIEKPLMRYRYHNRQDSRTMYGNKELAKLYRKYPELDPLQDKHPGEKSNDT